MADVDYNIQLVLDATNNASKELEKVGGQVGNLSNSFSSLGKVATGLGLTKVFKDLSSSILEYGGNLEQATISFETMLGSAEKAETLLTDLSEFAKKTPFELTGVRDNAKQLLGMGIEAEKILPTLKSLGDVSAGLSIDLSRVALNYGQVRTQGKLTGKELRDFMVQGIPLLDELAKNMGKTTTEVQDMISAGKVGFEDVEKAFQTMTSEGGRFADLMDKQSHSYQGMLSNLQDSFGQIKESIGMAILPLLESLLEKILPIVEKVSDRIAENQELAGKIAMVVGAVGLLAGGMTALGGILPLITAGISALAGPVGIVIGAITALGLAWATNFGGIKDKTQEVIDFIKPYIEEFVTEIQAFREQHGEEIKVFLQAMRERIKVLIEAAMEGIKLAFEGLFTVLGVLLDVFQGDWEGAWTKIKNFGLQIVQSIDKIMTRAFGDMWTNIKNGFMEGYNRIVDKVNALVDRIKRAVQSLKDAWNSAKERLGFGGGEKSGRAVGGPVYAGQQYLVGENGPEMFVPSQNGRIVRNEDLGQTGNTSININFGDVSINDGTDQQSLAETIASTITRQLELYKKGIY